MDKNELIYRIISKERLEPYLTHHQADFDKAMLHYKCNILISESFYPLLAVLEIGLRNSVDYKLTKRFNDRQWYENMEFIRIATRFQLDRISDAKSNISSEKKDITPGRIISNLTFGFWTSLFDVRFEMSLWKSLRLAFPNCPKHIRQRKTLSSKFNSIRKLRNRIFHHEAISWNLSVLDRYKIELLEGIDWLDKDLMDWADELNQIDDTINRYRGTIEL